MQLEARKKRGVNFMDVRVWINFTKKLRTFLQEMEYLVQSVIRKPMSSSLHWFVSRWRRKCELVTNISTNTLPLCANGATITRPQSSCLRHYRYTTEIIASFGGFFSHPLCLQSKPLSTSRLYKTAHCGSEPHVETNLWVHNRLRGSAYKQIVYKKICK